MSKRATSGRFQKTYSQEVIDFIRANTAAMSDSELCETINERFNLNTTKGSVKELRHFYRIMKGREKYKPYPTLTERTVKIGYVKIKNAAGKWVNKHTYLYEQAHGKVPKGENVIFLDGNKNNFSLDNLATVTTKEMITLLNYKLRFNDPALTKTGIAIVRHKNKIKARRNI